MQDGGELRLPARLDIGRRPDDDAGDRQPAEQARHGVGEALPHQFAIEIGAGPRVQLVGGHRAQQRFHARDRGDRDAADQHRDQQVRPRPHRKLKSGPKPALKIDTLDVEAQQDGRGGGRHHGHQRGRHHRQRTRHPLPGQQQGDGGQTEERGRGVQVAQLRRQGQQVLEGLTFGRSAEDDVQLCQRDGDADTGQHAVHDGRRHGEAQARNPRQAQDDLDESPDHHRCRDEAPVAELLDQTEDDGRQTGGRAGHLQRGAGDEPGHEAADDAGDEAGHDRRPGRQGDPEREGNGDQEHHEGREHVLARRREEPRASRLGSGRGDTGVRHEAPTMEPVWPWTGDGSDRIDVMFQ